MNLEKLKNLIEQRTYANNYNSINEEIYFISFKSEDNVIARVQIQSNRFNVKIRDIKVNKENLEVFTYEPVDEIPFYSEGSTLSYKFLDKECLFIKAMKEKFPELEI